MNFACEAGRAGPRRLRPGGYFSFSGCAQAASASGEAPVRSAMQPYFSQGLDGVTDGVTCRRNRSPGARRKPQGMPCEM